MCVQHGRLAMAYAHAIKKAHLTGTKMAMIPLYQIMKEAYSVYFKTTGFSEVKYSASGATVPSALSTDWSFEGAATTASKISGDWDLRTAGPKVVSTLTIAHPILGQGHNIKSVSLSYQYLSGFDSGPGAWPVLSVNIMSVRKRIGCGGPFSLSLSLSLGRG